MKFYILILFSLISIFSIGCKSKKTNIDTENVKEKPASFLMKKLIANQVEANWLTAGLKLDLDSEALKIGLSGKLRMEKDKAIWLSVSKFGFEVARALIEPDSVFVIDRINGERVAEDLSYIQKKLNFPANFQMIQSILMGNPVFFTKNFESKLDTVGYHLMAQNASPKSTYLLDSETFNLQKMTFVESMPPRSMEIFQSNYEQVDSKRNFSTKRDFYMNSKETGKMNLKVAFSNFEFDVPKSMPFQK